MTTLRLLLAVAITAIASVASAQTTTTSTTRYERDRVTHTAPDGSTTVTTRQRNDDGSRTYTTERTPAPPRLADVMRRYAPAASAPQRATRDGVWTGYEGSPRDVAWMEACRPTFTTDRHGMTRYVYAKRGCETGDPR